MKLSLTNPLFDLFIWRIGDEFPIEPGSILFVKNEKIVPNTLGHKVIYFGQLFHKFFSNTQSQFCNPNIIHTALVVNPSEKDGINHLSIIESNLTGVEKKDINLNEYIKREKKADAFCIFTPKSDHLRALLVSLANLIASKKNKIPYPYFKVFFSIFNHTEKSRERMLSQISSVIVDLLQNRQISEKKINQVAKEFCSSFIMILLQTSFAIEKISENFLADITKLPRAEAIKQLQNNLCEDKIPEGLQCLHDLLTPSELHNRLLLSSNIIHH